jgi:hypothetical protein
MNRIDDDLEVLREAPHPDLHVLRLRERVLPLRGIPKRTYMPATRSRAQEKQQLVGAQMPSAKAWPCESLRTD